VIGAYWIDGLQEAVDQVKRREVPGYPFYEGEKEWDEEECNGCAGLERLVSYT
jgi:hypothetical protein